jgi:hypothetical protein
VPDIIRYEQCRLAAEGSLFIGLLYAKYPLKALLHTLHHNDELALVGRRPSLAFWCKIPGMERPWHTIWTLPHFCRN